MRGFLVTDEFVEVVAQHTRNVLYSPIIHELERRHDPTFSCRMTVIQGKRKGTRFVGAGISGFRGSDGAQSKTWEYSNIPRRSPRSAKIGEILWNKVKLIPTSSRLSLLCNAGTQGIKMLSWRWRYWGIDLIGGSWRVVRTWKFRPFIWRSDFVLTNFWKHFFVI